MSSSGNPSTWASRFGGRNVPVSVARLYGKNSTRGPRRPARIKPSPILGLGLDLEHLPAAIHAGLEVDVVRAAQFARILVLDIGWLLQRIGGAAHAAPG